MSVLSSPVIKQNAPFSTIQSSNMIIYNNQSSVSSGSPISGGRLIIPNKKNIVNRQSNSAVLKPTGSPILNQANVRYIGQPNGKMQKVVYLPTNIRATSSPLITKPILNKTMAQLTPLQQQTIISEAGKSSTPQRIIGPVHNLAVKNAVPIFLNAQGIPLKVVNPSSISATSLTFPAHILPTQLRGTTSSATVSTPPTSQHLQGLKKAVEQVAAVTQINAKLQNHLQKQDTLIQPVIGESQVVRNPAVTPSKLFIKTENSGEKIPVTFKLSADQVALSRTLGVGDNKVVVSKNNIQPVAIPFSNVQPIQPKKETTIDTNQPGISFILTKNGLVSVSLPSQIQNKVKVNTVPSTQNIITSKMPAHILTTRPTLSIAPGMMTSSSKVSIIKIPTQSHTVSMNRMSVQQHVISSAVLSSVVANGTRISSTPSTTQLLSVSEVPTTSTSTIATTSVFINKMPTNILLSRPTPLTTHATITTAQAPVSLIAPKPQDPKDAKESTLTPSIFRTANNVTPEKLRDAEALLGLINPMHHSPKKPNTSSSEIVSPRSLLASVVSKAEPKPSSSSVSLSIDSPIKQQVFRHSIVNENNHLKINLPNSQSSNLAPPLKIPKMIQSPDKAKNPTGPLIPTKVMAGGHKMVVNASQLKKLHEEGKVVVTPSGQMFLMTGTKPLQQQAATNAAVTNNGKL